MKDEDLRVSVVSVPQQEEDRQKMNNRTNENRH